MTAANTPIEIVEVSPRDGLQNEATDVSTGDKVALVERAIAAGARRIEATSFVSPKAVPRMADAEAVMRALNSARPGWASPVVLAGLVVNRRGLDRAIAAGVDEVNFIVVATETFNQRNQGVSVAQSVEQLAQCLAPAREAGIGVSVTIGAAFGCPFEGEVPETRLREVLSAVARTGVDEIALADTIGVGDPLAVHRRVGIVQDVAPGARIRCHFHNTRNTGIANAYSAWQAGAHSLDASIGGIGGCPFAPAATGNIPTEDAVYMFERMGVPTGYLLAPLIEAARWLDGVLGRPVPGMLARAGDFVADPRLGRCA